MSTYIYEETDRHGALDAMSIGKDTVEWMDRFTDYWNTFDSDTPIEKLFNIQHVFRIRREVAEPKPESVEELIKRRPYWSESDDWFTMFAAALKREILEEVGRG